MSTLKEKYVISKNVRLPEKLHTALTEEALRTGIGQPSVMARMIIVERLNKGDLGPLAKIASTKPHIYMYDPRISIRLSEANMEKVNSAATEVSGGNFSGLVQAILIERYER